ncbi:MAG: sulfotransferase family 2 domain-containing protein [Gemmobacter sp.]
MPIFLTSKGLVLFAHVPRCGGSSVENYLHGRFGKLAFLDRDHQTHAEDRRWNRVSPQHVDQATLTRLMPTQFFVDAFAMVRHPVTRLESVYLHNLQVTGQIPPTTGFSDWLADLPAQHDRDAAYLDNHARPMVDLVPPQCRIFRLKDGFAAVERWLDDLTGTTWPRHIGRVHGRAQLLAKRGLTAVPRPVLTPDTLALIADLYAADFEACGYDAAVLPPQADDLAGPAGVPRARLAERRSD